MQRSLPSEARKVVPRWRELSRTPGVELVSSRPQKMAPIGSAVDEELNANWISAPSDWAALEIVSAALVTGRSGVADEAASRLAHAHLPSGAAQIFHVYADQALTPEEETFQDASIGERDANVERVRFIRRALVDFPRNPFLYVDLARSFVTLGEIEKAAHALHVALGLAPENRYVLRSATRFFVHANRADEIWPRLKGFGSSDPWIAASKISIADLLNRPQSGVKHAREIVERGDAAQTTELSAALGTLELGSGAVKKARRFFQESAKRPNDNSVAQIRWAHEEVGLSFDRKLLDVELSFEARTSDASQQHEWKEAVANAKYWLKDEPFSARAAQVGVFICAEYMQDFDQALLFCNLGLMANPTDAVLLNNRAFSNANLGAIAAAEVDIQVVRSRWVDTSDEIFLLATEGCIAYRKGDIHAGAELYGKSVEKALELGRTHSAHRARLHWLYEELRLGTPLDTASASALIAAFDKEESVELRGAFDSLIRPLINAVSQPVDIAEPRTTSVAQTLVS